MPIKSFRGVITPNGVDTITLHTNTGSTGYIIKKFQVMSTQPGTAAKSVEYVAQIFSVPQTTASATVDFSDQTLLAALHLQDQHSSDNPLSQVVIFDNMVFNQDIYVTLADADGDNVPGNYYIELEQVKLDLNENTVATLKDIRNIKSQ